MKQVKEDMFTPQKMREYEASKMAYRNIKNSIDLTTAWYRLHSYA